MCRFTNNRKNLCIFRFFEPTIHLVFSGDIDIYVYLDAYNQQLGMSIINENDGNTTAYFRGCKQCPVCGRLLTEKEDLTEEQLMYLAKLYWEASMLLVSVMFFGLGVFALLVSNWITGMVDELAKLVLWEVKVIGKTEYEFTFMDGSKVKATV